MASYNWTTADEIYFLRSLEAAKPASARNYATALLKGRRWDAGMDIERVEAEARRILTPEHPAMLLT